MKEHTNSKLLSVHIWKLMVLLIAGWSITMSDVSASTKSADGPIKEAVALQKSLDGLGNSTGVGPVIGTDDPVCPPKYVDDTPPVITTNAPLAGSVHSGSYIQINAFVEDAQSELVSIKVYASYDYMNTATTTLIETFEGNLGHSYGFTYYYNPPVDDDYDFVITAMSYDETCMTSLAATAEVSNVNYAYSDISKPVRQQISSPNTGYDKFGFSIAIDQISGISAGASIGAPWSGPVYKQGWGHLLTGSVTDPISPWSIIGAVIWGALNGDEYGKAVAIASNTNGGWAFVGAPGQDDEGAVIVVKGLGSGGWLINQTLKASNPATNARFGDALSLNYYGGNRLAVGAPGNDTVYMFELDANDMWYEVWSHTGPSNSDFGQSVLLHDKLFVGAPKERVNGIFQAGAVYVFNTAGTQHARLTAAEPGQSDHLGDALAYVEPTLVETLLVGAPDADITVNGNVNLDQGAMFVFKKADAGWVDTTEFQKFTAPDGRGGDRFGHALTNGDYPYVGAPNAEHDPIYEDQGAVYQLIQNSNGTFSQQGKFYLPFPLAGDRFGFALAAGDHTLMVGAPNCHNCIQNNLDPGNVYLFDK